MDIRFLESLVAVVETGSIAAAARRQKLTPAAVSQRMTALERNLGTLLLARGAHSAAPTDACLALLPRARHLIDELANLRGDLDEQGLSGEVRIGAISTALTGFFPAVLQTTARLAPNLKIQLTPGTSLQLYEQVKAGHLDGAVLAAPPFAVPKTLTSHLIRSEPLTFLSPRLVAAADIGNAIMAAPFIRYDPLAWGGRHVSDYLERQGLAPDISFDLDALETIALLVAKGMGNALVPAWPGIQQDGFHAMGVPDAAHFQRKILFIHRVSGRLKTLLFLKDRLVESVGR
ncbi:MAG: LysR family transcriptional regulator [Rhizobium sp.]